MTLSNQPSNSYLGERQKHWHKLGQAALPISGQCHFYCLSIKRLVLDSPPVPFPLSLTHPPERGMKPGTHRAIFGWDTWLCQLEQQHLPHLKRRNSELMFTFPSERRQRQGLESETTHAEGPRPSTQLTFWKDVYPVPMVKLLQNEVHPFLVDTISCRERSVLFDPFSGEDIKLSKPQ